MRADGAQPLFDNRRNLPFPTKIDTSNRVPNQAYINPTYTP